MAVAVLAEEQIQARMPEPHASWQECSRGHLHTPVTWGFVKNFRGFCYALHYNADCPPRSGWRKWRGQALFVHFDKKLLLATSDGSDACFVHGGGLLLVVGGGAYGGL